MSGFVLKRMGFAIITLIAVLTIVFFIVRILPGDPAMVILGDQASQQSIDLLRSRLGLDRPMIVQYFDFMSGVAIGDWGVSMVSGRPVISEVLKVLPATLELTFAALFLGAVIGIPLGVWAAISRNTIVDYVVRLASLLGLSFPAFVSAVLLLFAFAIYLPWFPVMSSGRGTSFGARLNDLALPAFNLGLIMAAYITRVARSAMLEVLGQDYVRTAKAKGLSPLRVISVHALRNAMITVVTVIGLQVAVLLAGAILTETIFSWPGIGKWIIFSVFSRDYYAVQGGLLLIAACVMVVNLIVDLLYGLINPRIVH